MAMSNDTMFCMGGSMSMAMLMNGFDWSWGATKMCVIFLFQNYEVNSLGLLVSTYVVTLVLAIALQLIRHFRVVQRRTIHGADYGRRMLQSFLYVVQVALGYLLMLIIMTYVVQLVMRGRHRLALLRAERRHDVRRRKAGSCRRSQAAGTRPRFPRSRID
jgi:hypothetical protein